MEHPVREIDGVITSLTTGSPEEQESTINTYFLPTASFTHPFCRVPSFDKGTIPFFHSTDSLSLIVAIYRWYRTLSPRIAINIESAVFDQRTSTLYVSINQTFALWFVPFYKAPVHLTTVLKLAQRTNWVSNETVGRNNITEGREPAPLAGPGQERARYYIESQEDLYQVNDFLNFLMPGFGPVLWSGWQLFATFLCVLGSLFFLPLYLILNKGNAGKAKSG